MSAESQQLQLWLEEIHRVLAERIGGWLVRQADWAMDLDDVQKAARLARGKQVRPRILLATHAACGGNFGPGIRDVACALELYHGVSLIYDDIQDNARRRRGQPTYHTTQGVSAALSLCALLSRLVNLMTLDNEALDAAARLRLTLRFTRAQIDVSTGQMAETVWVRDGRLDVPDEWYWRMIRGKTAALFAYAAETGADLGTGGAAAATQAFRETGERLGMLFQLVDDHADLFLADDGKPRGHDVREAKRTLYMLHARRTLPPADRAEFDRLYLLPERNDEQVAWLLDRIRASGAEEMGRAHVRRLAAEIHRSLDDLAERHFRDAGFGAELRATLVSICRGLA